jgi:hypothetical protein
MTARVAVASAALLLIALCPAARAQEPPPAARADNEGGGRASAAAKFLLGGAAGLIAHEGGHLFFNVVFDADPHFRRVEFHGIPFFALGHRADLTPRREFVISSAGFWVHHAGSELILWTRPGLRRERAPLLKGLLAFNVLASGAYAGAAFARTGPGERDTRGMAVSSGIDERWIGAMVLTPALLDAWRYYDPDAEWAKWLSRAAKVGMVLLVFRT